MKRTCVIGWVAALALTASNLSRAATSTEVVRPEGDRIILPLGGIAPDRAESVLTSLSGTAVASVKDPEGARVARIPFAGSLPGRIVWMAAGPAGFAPPSITLVDLLPSVPDAGTNRSLVSAQFLTLPVAVDGTLTGRESRCYAFNLGRGETVSLEAVARQIGSTLDPSLSVTDPRGTIVLQIDDTPGADRDVAVRFTATRKGLHRLTLTDSLGEGSEPARFRLRLHAGEPSALPFLGTSGVSGIAMAPSPKLPRDQAERVDAPAMLHGTFRRSGEVFRWKLAGDPVSPVHLRFRTRSIGSWADVLARVRDPKGQVIAELDASGSGDGTMAVTFSTHGDHTLEVVELARSFGPNCFFQAELVAGSGLFELALNKNQLEIAPGESEELKVTVTRRDFGGPIRLDFEGLPSGFRIEPSRIEAKSKEATLTLHCPTNPASAGPWILRLTGSRTNAANLERIPAGTRGPLLNQWPNLHQPPAAWDGRVALRLKARKP
jgi:hypothetical protein